MKNKLHFLLTVLALLAFTTNLRTHAATVFPIATNGVASQAGIFAAFGGSNYLVGIQGDGTTNSAAITAQLVSTNGTLLGSRILTGHRGGIPYVASGATNYLLVWSDNALVAAGGKDQLYGRFVSRSGVLVGTNFTFGPTNEEQDMQGGGGSLLAFDGQNFLAVWDTGPFHNANFGNVHGTLFSQTGSPIVRDFIIITNGYEIESTPVVTFGKTNYLVVWNDVSSGDIDGEFVSTNGTPGFAFTISQTYTPSYNPCCAAFDGTNFLVVYNINIAPQYPNPAIWNLYGRLISPDGTFPTNEVAMVPVFSNINSAVYPSIGFDGTNYLLAWNEGGLGLTNSQIVFQFFNPSAAPAGPQFQLFSPQATNTPFLGGVLFAGSRFEITAIMGGATGVGSSALNFTSGTRTWGTFQGTATPLVVTTTSLPNGTHGAAYSQTLSAYSGQTPYSWTNSSGTLPPGLTLAANGLISGTPTTNGTFNFTVRVTDALSATAAQPLTLTVGSPPSIVAIQPTNQSVAVAIGTNVSFIVSVTGIGPFSYQWQLNGTNLPNGIITTVAGNDQLNLRILGDGGAATNAELSASGVAVDPNGNLFIADLGDERIRKVGTNGIINTVAGNGFYGYSGDGGAATNAKLNLGPFAPNGVAVDVIGNLFIADFFNSAIREVGTNGIINTVASLDGPAGIAEDAVGNLFIADYYASVIFKLGTNMLVTEAAGNFTSGYTGDGSAALGAELDAPTGVAVDAIGNLFIADSGNFRIRKVGTNGIINTVAGGGGNFLGDGGAATNAVMQPVNVVVDKSGNLFIADASYNRIREVGTNGIINTVAGNGTANYSGDGGAAPSAELNYPQSVAVDATGNLFIADSGNNVIRKVVNAGIPGPTLALYNVGYGNSGAYDVVVSNPYGSVTSSVVNVIILPLQVTTTSLPMGANGMAYNQTLAAIGGQTPYRWTNSSGTLPSGLTLATNGVISGTPTTNGTFNFTVKLTDALSETATQAFNLTLIGIPGIVPNPTNNSVTVPIGNNVTFSVSVSGTGPFSYQWQLNGTNLPNGIISTVAGNGIGGYSGDGGAAISAKLYYPSGVAVDATGNLFIADAANERIRKVGINGIITTIAGNGTYGYFGDGDAATNAELKGPEGVAVDSTGNLFIADVYNNRIRKVGTNGIISTVAGNGTNGYSGDGGAATNAELYDPSGVMVDATGNLFIADAYNERIREVGTNGIINTVAGNGYGAYGYGGYSGDGGAATNAELYDPSGVAVDAVGNLFIADYYNQRIREVRTNGIITTVAGNGYGAGTGNGGYSGDGGAATNFELNNPIGVAVDATGNLFIGDGYNQRIREVIILGPTLVLNDVGYANAGAYDLVVFGPFGSITSSVVHLTIALPSVILSQPQIIGKTNFTFQLTGSAGSNYVLQVSTNLLNWSNVITSTIPVSGTTNLTYAISNYNRRFYRAVIP